MGFLNAMLLIGTAAFAVPLGIHLLNRSRFHSVDWAAMHLLDMSDLQNARRIEWRSLLLLLLRCLVPVMLAVCMARPVLQTAAVAGASGRSTTLLLLDDSFSMQGEAASQGEPESGWQSAAGIATTIVDGVTRQAELAVVAMGGEARRESDLTRLDPRPVLGAISRLEPKRVDVDLVGAFRLAGESLVASRQPHRQVVLLSDFQRGNWSGSVEAAINAIQESWKTLPAPPELHLIPLEIAKQSNVSVTFDAPTAEVTLLGEPVDLPLTLQNDANQPIAGLPLRVLIDGRTLVSRKVDLPANATSQVLFTIDMEAAGAHEAVVEIEDPSGWMVADDSDRLTLQVLPTRRVLMIEQEVKPSLLDCETGFIQLALESTAREAGAGQAALVRRVAAADVREAMVEESDVIVVANVARLADDAVGWIATRVAAGGRLCFFSGAALDLAWYEQVLGGSSPTPLLPWKYGDPQTPVTVDGVVVGETIQTGPYSDPLLAFFDDPQHGQLDTVSLTGWRGMEARDPLETPGNAPDAVGPDHPPPPAEVLLHTKAGLPLLVAAGYGQGRVLQWAVAANEASGSLPREPVFVPLMQRLLLLDLQNAVPRNVEERRLESRLDPLSPVERASLAQRLGATLHATASDFLAHERNRQGGEEIWRWLLAVVVVLLFAEMTLAGRLTRRGGQ